MGLDSDTPSRYSRGSPTYRPREAGFLIVSQLGTTQRCDWCIGMEFFTSNRFAILLGVVIALCSVVAEFLEAQYSQEEKQEFARTLNQRWFQHEKIPSSVSVFKAAFDSADILLSKFFGSKIFTIRSIYLSFVASTFFTIVNIGLIYFTVPQKNYQYLNFYNWPLSLLIFLYSSYFVDLQQLYQLYKPDLF
jgi:hypothetical protein